MYGLEKIMVRFLSQHYATWTLTFDLKYTPSITRAMGDYSVNTAFCRTGAFRSGLGYTDKVQTDGRTDGQRTMHNVTSYIDGYVYKVA